MTFLLKCGAGTKAAIDDAKASVIIPVKNSFMLSDVIPSFDSLSKFVLFLLSCGLSFPFYFF